MKKISSYLCLVAVFAMLFASCSKDEEVLPNDDTSKATLSFGAMLKDLTKKAADKQAVSGDVPECSAAEPAYVEVVLTQDGAPVVGTSEEPFQVNLVDGQVFTEEAPELELEPGTYDLEHFMVYDAEGNLLWVAPKGGPMAQFVENDLPLEINLGAGVKKYVEVSVICYDDRDVKEYGYMFYEFDTNQAIEFCLFGNYCAPNGRHYPAKFSVDVWTWVDGERGVQIHDDVTNTVEPNQYGDYAGSPVCVPLPDKEGQDEYYFEVTMLDSEAYGDVEERIIRTGVINDTEVRNFFDGENNLDYYHFREGAGCENEDNPPIFEEPGDDAVVYRACLTPMNDSDAFAFAYFRLDGNTLQTNVMAVGVEPGMAHPQHIHAKDSGNSECPPEEASGDDSIITLEEGLPYYGEVRLALTMEDGSFPVASAAGSYFYERTFTLGEGGVISAEDLPNLVDGAVVVHGMEMGDEYVASLPVSCAEIFEQE